MRPYVSVILNYPISGTLLQQPYALIQTLKELPIACWVKPVLNTGKVLNTARRPTTVWSLLHSPAFPLSLHPPPHPTPTPSCLALQECSAVSGSRCSLLSVTYDLPHMPVPCGQTAFLSFHSISSFKSQLSPLHLFIQQIFSKCQV